MNEAAPSLPPPTASCERRPAEARCTLCNAGPPAATTRYYCPRSVSIDLDATLDDGGADATLVPGYWLRGTLGQGGMGAVYLCESEQTGEQVAVKRLTNLRSSVHVKRFEREIATLALLDLPGVVRIVDHGRHEGTPWFAMEWVKGPSLAEVLDARSTLPVSEAVRIVAEVARIVHRVHEHGLVHRDIKPRNIVLRTDGQPVLVDFGLTRHLDEQAHTAHTRRPIGTPAYMAPELLKTTDVDWIRVDVYSLGVVLARAVLGRLPKGEWDLDGVPDRLRGAIEGSLASQPERRFASAALFADALETAEPSRSRRWWGLGGAVALAVVVGGLATCGAPPPTAPEVQGLLTPWHDRRVDDPAEAQRLFLSLVDRQDPATASALWVARAETLNTPVAWGDAWAHVDAGDTTTVVQGLAEALRAAGDFDGLDALLVDRADELRAEDAEALALLQATVDAYHLRLDRPFGALPEEHRRLLDAMAERRDVGEYALQPTTRRWTCDATRCWTPDGETWDVGGPFRAVWAEGRLLTWTNGRIDDVETGRGCDLPDQDPPHDGTWWNDRLQLVRSGGSGSLHRIDLETCERTRHPDAERWQGSYINRTLAWDADGDGVDEQVVFTGAPFDYQLRLYDTDDQLIDVLRIGDAVHGAVWNGDLVVATDRPHASSAVFGDLVDLGAYRIVFEDGEMRRVQVFPGHYRAVKAADLDGDGHSALYLVDHLHVLWIRETPDSEPLRIGRVSMLEAADIDGDGADELVMERLDASVVVFGDGGSDAVGRAAPDQVDTSGDPAVDAAMELHAMGLTSIAASRLAVQALARPRGEAPWGVVAELQEAAQRPDEAIEAWSRMGREGRPEGYDRAVRQALRHGDIDAATALTAEWGTVPEELRSSLVTRVIDFHRAPSEWTLVPPLATWNADRQLLRFTSMGDAGPIAEVALDRRSSLAGLQLDLSIEQLEFAADVRIHVVDAAGDGPMIRVHAFGSRHRIGRTITAQKYEFGDVLDDDPYGPHRSTVVLALDGDEAVVRVIDEDGAEKRQPLRESLPEGPLRLLVEVRGPPGAMADVALHRLTVWGLDTVPGTADLPSTAGRERAIRNTGLRTSPALETLRADRPDLLAAHTEITSLAWNMHRSSSRLGRRLIGLPGADDQAVIEAAPVLASNRADAMLSRGDPRRALAVLDRIPEGEGTTCLRRNLLRVAAHEALDQKEEAQTAQADVADCGARPVMVATARWGLGLDPGDPL